MFAGKKSAQIREILISESAWEEMTCLFAPSLGIAYIALFARQHMTWIYPLIIGMIIFIIAPYVPDWLS